MSYADAIRSASSPSAALLVIAEGIDDFDARLAALEAAPADGWGQWENSPTSNEGMIAAGNAVRPLPDNTEAIAAVEAALAKATDAHDIQALSARLRLLKDDGASVDTAPPAGIEAVTEEVGDEIVTTLLTVDDARQQARYDFADSKNLHEFFALPRLDFLDAFVKGGPLWLYHTARDEVMTMPHEWRQWMVEEVSQDSPRTAQELGRDLLKDEGTGNKDVALDVIGVSE